MRCEKIMKREVECVLPTETIQIAAQRMRDENIGFLPVCEENGKVVGVVTDRDIVIRAVAAACDGQTTVEQVMSRECVSVSPEDDVREAERQMGRHQKSRIMCVDGSGILVGVISLSDIAQHEGGARAARTMREVTQREARA